MTRETLILDTSPLVHFARAGELGALAQLLKDFDCVTTRAVRDETRRGVENYPRIREACELDWIRTVATDDLETLYRFSQYMKHLGNSDRNAGEASVLAWAEINSAVAYVDDQAACNIGRKRGVRVYRTLHLVINAFRSGILGEPEAQRLVRNLADSDARFPQQARDDLFAWARMQDPPLL